MVGEIHVEDVLLALPHAPRHLFALPHA